MATVEVKLNHYTYSFRKLAYREEFALNFAKNADPRKVLLAASLINVSGLATTPGEALTILSTLPQTVLTRIWILYKAGITPDRFFTTKSLYQAPEFFQLIKKFEDSEDRRSAVVDKSAKEVERRLVEDARRRGALTKATPEGAS